MGDQEPYLISYIQYFVYFLNYLLVWFLYVNMVSCIDVRVNADRYSVRVPANKRNNTSRFQLRFWIFVLKKCIKDAVPILTWIYFIGHAWLLINIKVHHFWEISLDTNHSSPNKSNRRVTHLFCRGKKLNLTLFQATCIVNLSVKKLWYLASLAKEPQSGVSDAASPKLSLTKLVKDIHFE